MLSLHSRHVLDDPAVLSKFWFVVYGIYIWEFITSLDYEWSVIRGQRPYRWTIWIYSITRLSTLVAVIINLIIFADTSRLNCQVMAVFSWLTSFLALSTGSLLLALRTVAIWDKNKVIMAIATGLWVINTSFLTYGVTQTRATWSPLAKFCISTNVGASKPSYIALFATDALLLLIMLAGLLRLRRYGGGSFELWRLLWKQGIIWFTISTIAELLQMLFLVLDINTVLSALFLLPSMVTLAIASTRLYRSLTNFSSPVESPQDVRSISNSKRASFLHASSHQLEVTVHRAYEEHPVKQTNHSASYTSSSDVQLSNKPHEIILGDNMEDRAKK